MSCVNPTTHVVDKQIPGDAMADGAGGHGSAGQARKIKPLVEGHCDEH
jgi:hypothetical protein